MYMYEILNKKKFKKQKLTKVTISQWLIFPEVRFKYMDLEWCVQPWG